MGNHLEAAVHLRWSVGDKPHKPGRRCSHSKALESSQENCSDTALPLRKMAADSDQRGRTWSPGTSPALRLLRFGNVCQFPVQLSIY